MFYIYGKNYIKISGLRVINVGPDNNASGILVQKSNNVIIEKNYTYNTKSSGIGVWECKNILVAENEVVLANNDGDQENITIASTSYFEVKDNHIHDGGPSTNGGEGIDAKHSNTGKIYRNHLHHFKRVGIYIDAWDTHTYDIDVFQNIVHDVIADGFALSSEMGGFLENIRLFNNLSYKNDYGINITSYGDSSNHPMQNILTFNNTIANNGLGSWGGGVLVDNPDIENLVIANNIVSDNLSFQIVVYPHVLSNQVLVNFNLIYGFRGIEEGETKGTNYVEGNPYFIDINTANYRLNSSSPAINAGSNSYLSSDVTKDLDGNPRIVGGKVDIGAYER